MIKNDFIITLNSHERFHKNEEVKLIIRPENVKVYKNFKKDALKGEITTITYNGDSTKLTVSISSELSIDARIIDETKYDENDTVYIDFDEDFIVPLRS